MDELTEEYGKPPTPKQLVAAVGGKELLSVADALTILSDLCTLNVKPNTRKRKDACKAAAKAAAQPSEVLPEEPVPPEELKNEKAESMELEDVDGQVPTEEEMGTWNMFQKEDPTEQETQPAEAAAVGIERGTSQRCGLTCPYLPL